MNPLARIPNVTLATELTIGRIREAGISTITARDLILTIVPEVESRIEEMIRELVSRAKFAPTALGSFLIKDNLDSYFQSWKEREKILKDVFGFSVSGSKIGQDFQLLVDVRNALMHGNGSFTSQQSQSLTAVLTLKKKLGVDLSVEVQGQKLLLDGLNRIKVCDAASKYLVEADLKCMGSQ